MWPLCAPPAYLPGGTGSLATPPPQCRREVLQGSLVSSGKPGRPSCGDRGPIKETLFRQCPTWWALLHSGSVPGRIPRCHSVLGCSDAVVDLAPKWAVSCSESHHVFY